MLKPLRSILKELALQETISIFRETRRLAVQQTSVKVSRLELLEPVKVVVKSGTVGPNSSLFFTDGSATSVASHNTKQLCAIGSVRHSMHRGHCRRIRHKSISSQRRRYTAEFTLQTPSTPITRFQSTRLNWHELKSVQKNIRRNSND